MATQDELKKQVGYKAVDDYVESGMIVGLGTGSTAAFAVERVGEKLKSGELKDIIAIPTSIRTKEQARRTGLCWPGSSNASRPALTHTCRSHTFLPAHMIRPRGSASRCPRSTNTRTWTWPSTRAA